MGYKPKENAWQLFIDRAAIYAKPKSAILEMGPGHKVHRSLIYKFTTARGCRYHHADTQYVREAMPGFVRMLDEHTLDSPSDRFDMVISYQMLHNVWKPWRWLPEVARVLKAGGLVIIVDSIQERRLLLYNRHPYDCGRIYPDGMRALFDEAGLAVVATSVRTEDGRYIRRRQPINPGLAVNFLMVGRKACSAVPA